MIALALFSPTLAAYLVLRHSWGRTPSEVTPALALSVSPGLGIAMSSCLYFGLLLLTGGHRQAVRLDSGLWLIADCWLLIAAARRRRRQSSGEREPSQHAIGGVPLEVLVAALGCLVLAVVAGLSFWLYSTINPHGEWDAWAIWNLRARSIFRGVPDWSAVFSPTFPGADYPPLLPVAVARLWAYAGREDLIVPAVVALVFSFSSTAIVVVSVGQLRGWATGWMSGLTLLAARTFVFQSSGQCADVPLGFFILVAIVFLAMAREARRPGPLLVIAGGAAGFAALTKNEGALLLILVLLVAGIAMRRLRAIALVVAGVSIPALALVYVKLHMTTSTNYLFSPEGTTAFAAKLFDGARWTIITERLAHLLAAWGGVPGGALLALAIAIALTARFSGPSVIRAMSALLLVAAVLFGYTLVYVLTPLNVEWQIAVSFDRLVTQLWPALVWGAFQLSGSGKAAPHPVASPA